MKFIDFFSGIGGFRLGMELNGHECMGHCEIDKFADKSYRAMYDVKGDEWYANDIRNVEPRDLPEADCYCGGFPCQSFSIAGKRGGFEDTRGTLFFEVMRLAAVRKPKYLFLENVAGLLSHDGGKTFGTILNTLGELGYWYEYQVLNSKDLGVPQNRERIFIIGHLGRFCGRKIFPITTTNKGLDIEVMGYTRDSIVKDRTRILNVDGSCQALRSTDYKDPVKKDPVKIEVRAILTPDRAEKRQNGRRVKDPGEDIFTLTAQDKHGVMISCLNPRKDDGTQTYQQDRVFDSNGILPALTSPFADRANTTINSRIRRLTPRECFRLQGFLDEYFERAAAVNSDSQLYKQAGNSVTVNVIKAIAKRMG